jgi:UPF0755 protein
MSDGSKPEGAGAERPRASLFGRRAPRSPMEALQAQAAPPPPEPPRKPRREGLSRISGLLSFILIGAVIGIFAFADALREARKPGPLAADKVVIISREDEAEGAGIADQLERAGVIDSTFWFNLVVLADGARGKLKRGEYLFKEHASLREVEETLVSGKPVQHKMTVPEGLTSQQVIQRLRADDALVGDIRETPREGSILPDTYFFQRGETREALLSRMEKAQSKVVDEIWQGRAANLPIKSPGELVTLASIVEKETGKADERPRVAGVFVNRLGKRMKLQSDPTIVYGLVGGKGTLDHPITKAELEQPTPYNTYVIEGLPPGPIANPGKAALEAAANPSHSKDLYFVADGTGGHAFAETLDQHLKNVDHWRQIEKDAKDAKESKDRLAPDLIPTPAAAQPVASPPAAQKKSEFEPPDPKVFGALAPTAAPKPTASLNDFAMRLNKIGADRAFERKDRHVSGAIAETSAPKPTASLNDFATRLDKVGADRALEPQDRQLFGALAETAGPKPTASLVVFATRLVKLGADREARQALLGPKGSIAVAASKNIADSGLIVEGVNDEALMQTAEGDDPATAGPVQSYPVPAQMLADQQSREARYAPWLPTTKLASADPDPAPVDKLPPGVRPHGFDASEGTPLDPLLNKTYDLNYAQTVPAIQLR